MHNTLAKVAASMKEEDEKASRLEAEEEATTARSSLFFLKLFPSCCIAARVVYTRLVYT